MWQTIPSFSRYEISKSGKVRHRRHKRVLKGNKPYNGYLQVGIHSDILNRCVSKCIHQLMALTFLGKKPLKHEIAHIDENKENNKLSNLKYIYWRKNRTPRTKSRNSCIVCGKETHNKFYCSKKCQWLDKRKLVKCTYCGIQFFRQECILNSRTPERGYTRGQIFCSKKCNGLYKRNKPR